MIDQLRQTVLGLTLVAALCAGMILGDALADHEQPPVVCDYRVDTTTTTTTTTTTIQAPP